MSTGPKPRTKLKKTGIIKGIIKDFKKGHAANKKAAREFKRDLMLGKKGMDPERLRRQQTNTKRIMSIRKKRKK